MKTPPPVPKEEGRRNLSTHKQRKPSPTHPWFMDSPKGRLKKSSGP